MTILRFPPVSAVESLVLPAIEFPELLESEIYECVFDAVMKN